MINYLYVFPISYDLSFFQFKLHEYKTFFYSRNDDISSF